MTGSSTSSVFPAKLFRLLDEASKEKGYEDVISWSADGKSFKVHDKERFAKEIMPTYFGSSKYRSFQKNLNMWGFKAARKGECSHPLFVRGKESLVHQMKRQLVNRQKQRAPPPPGKALAGAGTPEDSDSVSKEENTSIRRRSFVEDAATAAVESSFASSLKQHQQAAAAAAAYPPRSNLATIEVLRRRSSTGSMRPPATPAATALDQLPALRASSALPTGSDRSADAILSELLRNAGLTTTAAATTTAPSPLPAALAAAFAPAPAAAAAAAFRRSSLPTAAAATHTPTTRLSGPPSSLETDALALRLLLLEEQRSREQDNLSQLLRNRMNELALLSELHKLNHAVTPSSSSTANSAAAAAAAAAATFLH